MTNGLRCDDGSGASTASQTALCPMHPRPIPERAGIGLRACHHADLPRKRPPVGWVEAHSENYFGGGGPARRALARARECYPLSLHGVGMSLGSADPLNPTHLAEMDRLIRDFEPAFVSEHLAWGSVDGWYLNDLLPLPYTGEALRHMVRRASDVQDALGRQILIENISSYLSFRGPEMTEWEFLAQLAQASGCGLLLDVNNIYVSAINHGFDAQRYLQGIPVGFVREMHLAGHSVRKIGHQQILIDTHSAPVCAAVWKLYEQALTRFGPTPTLIEWDTDIPALTVLVDEALRANRYLEQCHALVA